MGCLYSLRTKIANVILTQPDFEFQPFPLFRFQVFTIFCEISQIVHMLLIRAEYLFFQNYFGFSRQLTYLSR
jgi:hypothetical protein